MQGISPFMSSSSESVVDLTGKAPWRDKMRSGECRKKVVEAIDVGQVDHIESDSEALLIPAKEILLPNRKINGTSHSDARGVLVVVFSTCRRDTKARGT